MGFGPVGRFVVSDKGVATEVEVTAVVARLADHLRQQSHDQRHWIT